MAPLSKASENSLKEPSGLNRPLLPAGRKRARGNLLKQGDWLGWPDPSPVGWVAVTDGARIIALFESPYDAEAFIRARLV
jgi:hypothetical protein